MPRVCRRLRQRKQYSEGDRRLLESGHAFFDCNVFSDGVEPSREAVAAAWAEIGGQILSDWIAEKPGTRPWAWWELEAPVPRRLISGPGSSLLRDLDAPAWTKKLWFGKPSCWGLEYFENPSTFESEVDYLRRLDLLTPGKVAALESARL